MKTKLAIKKIFVFALLVTTNSVLWAQEQPKGKFSLPPLPYEANALAPVKGFDFVA